MYIASEELLLAQNDLVHVEIRRQFRDGVRTGSFVSRETFPAAHRRKRSIQYNTIGYSRGTRNDTHPPRKIVNA
jgi:hypothetical protein